MRLSAVLKATANVLDALFVVTVRPMGDDLRSVCKARGLVIFGSLLMRVLSRRIGTKSDRGPYAPVSESAMFYRSRLAYDGIASAQSRVRILRGEAHR